MPRRHSTTQYSRPDKGHRNGHRQHRSRRHRHEHSTGHLSQEAAEVLTGEVQGDQLDTERSPHGHSPTRCFPESGRNDVPPTSSWEVPGEPRMRRRKSEPQDSLWSSLCRFCLTVGIPLIIEGFANSRRRRRTTSTRHRGRSEEPKETTHFRAPQEHHDFGLEPDARVQDWAEQRAEETEEIPVEAPPDTLPSVPDPSQEIEGGEERPADTDLSPNDDREAAGATSSSLSTYYHVFTLSMTAERLASLGGKTGSRWSQHKSSRPRGWNKIVKIPDTYDSLPLDEWMRSVGWSWKNSEVEGWTPEDSMPEELRLGKIDKSRTCTGLSRQDIDDVKSKAWTGYVRFYQDVIRASSGQAAGASSKEGQEVDVAEQPGTTLKKATA
ncbi:hypothetical protein L202_06943 [Cryptococcus amylolentus CBS 6039]|uniref:Uncharacterized protein n=1 Tax=Cryptococcus amylolentus CBS 6039 TaxID=1295533 RepID=A0A1E3HE38_9TREE|nr:hypothetical protein L202_06943 [Cryptococcus amylolentus CBS 6039]ODN74584.1 hypothetical protein L202_06943 [Cryptococcus amylolentus CBS 6039]